MSVTILQQLAYRQLAQVMLSRVVNVFDLSYNETCRVRALGLVICSHLPSLARSSRSTTTRTLEVSNARDTTPVGRATTTMATTTGERANELVLDSTRLDGAFFALLPSVRRRLIGSAFFGGATAT